jgi:hypothetical protein
MQKTFKEVNLPVCQFAAGFHCSVCEIDNDVFVPAVIGLHSLDDSLGFPVCDFHLEIMQDENFQIVASMVFLTKSLWQ